MRNLLLKEGYDVPENVNLDGTIVTHDNLPTIGIWLMPNNNIAGMLEDFCIELADVKTIKYIEQTVNKAKLGGHTNFKKVHYSKSVIHTFLAWQDTPGMPLGQSITAQALNADRPLANRFIKFLQTLFQQTD